MSNSRWKKERKKVDSSSIEHYLEFSIEKTEAKTLHGDCCLLFQKQSQEVFCKKGVLKNFANFTGKHLWWSLFLIKLPAFRPGTLLKRDSNTGVFQWNLQRFLRTPALKNICDRLLLIIVENWWFFLQITSDIFAKRNPHLQ